MPHGPCGMVHISENDQRKSHKDNLEIGEHEIRDHISRKTVAPNLSKHS